MATSHGKKTVVILNGVNLSQYTNTSTVEITPDMHDVTTYGSDWHLFVGGLLTGNFTLGGFYDTTAVTGPRAVMLPLVGQTVTFIHRPEGTGSGLPQDSCSVVVGKYTQTHPTADMVTWALELQGATAVVSTPQT